MSTLLESESQCKQNSIATHNENVRILNQAQIGAIPFAVSLSKSTIQNFDEPTPKGDILSLMGNNGVVGTIILLKNSAMVWVGWGKIDVASSTTAAIPTATTTNETTTTSTSDIRFGKGMPTMGQLVVAMPRTNYKGAFGTGSKEPSCSHIIGGDNNDDQMLASQMASRLSVRSGMAIFVSCQLSSNSSSINNNNISSDPFEDWSAGMDSDMISHRAAALAEKEIWRILQEQKQK